MSVEVSLLIFRLRLKKQIRLIFIDRKADDISQKFVNRRKLAIPDNQVLSTTPESGLYDDGK